MAGRPDRERPPVIRQIDRAAEADAGRPADGAAQPDPIPAVPLGRPNVAPEGPVGRILICCEIRLPPPADLFLTGKIFAS